MSDKTDEGVVVPVLASQSADSVEEKKGPLTLRQAREQAGLHVVALAVMLKVPVKKLEALEAGRFDELPDATFARALALSVCRQLKIDPAPILVNLPQLSEVRLDSTQSTLNTPFPVNRISPSGSVDSGPGRHIPWPVWLALALLVAAAAVWMWMPQSLQLLPETANDGQAVTAVKEIVLQETAPSIATEPPAQPPMNTSSAEPDAAASTDSPAPVLPAPIQQPSTQEVISPAPEASKPISSVPTSDEWLRLTARQQSWVEVISTPSGRLVMQRNLETGETVALTSGGPFAVVVGRADVTDVWVRGKRLDIESLARSNVARFEVK